MGKERQKGGGRGGEKRLVAEVRFGEEERDERD